MSDKVYNVLFLCTGNSARSIMAEALLNTMGEGRFHAYSAGSHHSGTVNPFAIEQITKTGYPLTNLRSKSWNEFGTLQSTQMDLIITVCDNATGEICPYWPGHPLVGHWGFEDPAAVDGTDEQKREVFRQIFKQIKSRLTTFVNLPLSTMDKTEIKREIDAIGTSKV